jgi:cytochrome c oxidase cbb3-type subunit 3
VFGVGYLVLFPGMGTFKGVLGWTEKGQYEREIAAADKQFNPLYEKYLKEDLKLLAANPEALKTGARLFVNYCTGCHGSDAGGGPGFPNLRDEDWLYGGDPQIIQTTILNGRQGAMPAWGAVLGPDGTANVAEYVLSRGGHSVNETWPGPARKIHATVRACQAGRQGTWPARAEPDRQRLYGGSRPSWKPSTRPCGACRRMPSSWARKSAFAGRLHPQPSHPVEDRAEKH